MFIKIITVVLAVVTVYSENKTFTQKTILQHQWLRPIADKISAIVALTKHPNYGGVQLFSPQHLWEKLHEKGGSYLTGPLGSIFGTSHKGQVDYPFAYRRQKNSRV